MKYTQKGDSIMLEEAHDFNIGQILECGQCFRFEKLDDGFYEIVAMGKVLLARQKGDCVAFSYHHSELGTDEFKAIWMPYFDLQRDYGAIKAMFADCDIMAQAMAFAPGIRILNQDPWETVVSFIISQNNRIPQIKQVIRNICARYGKQIEGSNHFSFPSPEQLAEANLEDLRICKTGFRDKYILGAARAATSGDLILIRESSLTTAELRANLMAIHGIGEKVAHCCLLFGYSRFDAFPVDVWVRRAMQSLYFQGQPTPAAEILAFANEKFGEHSGFAQQYLFHYARLNGIGTK